jgi:hypothetical protein
MRFLTQAVAPAMIRAGGGAAFVHGAVLDIDGGRVNVLTSADAAAVSRPDPAS